MQTIVINQGPTIGLGMLHVTFDLISFLVTLILVLRIGPGKIAQPILLIGFGFLFSALIPLTFGVENLWAVPLVQSVFGLLGILSFMHVYGVFDLIFGREKKKK